MLRYRGVQNTESTPRSRCRLNIFNISTWTSSYVFPCVFNLLRFALTLIFWKYLAICCILEANVLGGCTNVLFSFAPFVSQTIILLHVMKRDPFADLVLLQTSIRCWGSAFRCRFRNNVFNNERPSRGHSPPRRVAPRPRHNTVIYIATFFNFGNL